jgi:hypothetical protein
LGFFIIRIYLRIRLTYALLRYFFTLTLTIYLLLLYLVTRVLNYSSTEELCYSMLYVCLGRVSPLLLAPLLLGGTSPSAKSGTQSPTRRRQSAAVTVWAYCGLVPRCSGGRLFKQKPQMALPECLNLATNLACEQCGKLFQYLNEYSRFVNED